MVELERRGVRWTYFLMRQWAATMVSRDIIKIQINNTGWLGKWKQCRRSSSSYYRSFLMLSQSIIPEVIELDVLLVGNLAAIAGDFLLGEDCKWKIAVTHLESELKEPSLFPLANANVSVSKRPACQLIRRRIRRINAAKKYAILEDGKKIAYQLMIFGEESSKWVAVPSGSPFREALLTSYSKVYANCDSQWQKMLECESGNLVFYVGKGPNHTEQNYPFLYLSERLTPKQREKVSLIILVEGNCLFQHCPLAHRILESTLKEAKFKIIYNVTVTKIDYLRRTLSIVTREKNIILTYEGLYCCLPETPPHLLTSSSIDPYCVDEKYLHNLQHNSIYVIGGSILPTTHSFAAINQQMHVIVGNVKQRLFSIQFPSRQLKLCVYQGNTTIKIILSNSELLQIDHGYKDHESKIHKACTNITFFLSQHLEPILVQKYYNFVLFGLPHYFCRPFLALQPASTEEESSLSLLHLNKQPF